MDPSFTFDAGAFMYWVHGANELEKTGDYRTAVETGCWGRGVDPRAVLSDTRVLDVLLHNSDRHSGVQRHAKLLLQQVGLHLELPYGQLLAYNTLLQP